MPRRILMVEDSRDDAELTVIALADAGLDVACECVDSEDALERALREARPDVVLCDLSLPGFDPVRALEQVRALAPGVPFVVLSGHVPDGHEIFAAPLPPDAQVEKHLPAVMVALVRTMLARPAP